MADLDQRLRDVKTAVATAQTQKARAEVQAETAAAAVARARERLREQFGVESPEDGRRVLAQLEQELEAAVTETQNALERTA